MKPTSAKRHVIGTCQVCAAGTMLQGQQQHIDIGLGSCKGAGERNCVCLCMYIYIERWYPTKKKASFAMMNMYVYIYMYISHTGIICYIDDSLWLTVKLAKPISPPLRKKNKSIGAIGDIYIYNHHKLRC